MQDALNPDDVVWICFLHHFLFLVVLKIYSRHRVAWSLLLLSCSVLSNSFQPHGLLHNRLLCLSPSPGVCSNSCPLSQRCYPTISSSAATFSSCPQSYSLPIQDPASDKFSHTLHCNFSSFLCHSQRLQQFFEDWNYNKFTVLSLESVWL